MSSVVRRPRRRGSSAPVLVAAALAAVAAVVAAPAPAAAAGLTCQLGEPGLIEVDGAVDDWGGLPKFRDGGGGDLAIELRCAFDERALYLLIEVADDKVVRTRQGRASGEDGVSVSLAAASGASPLRFRVLPGSPTGARKLEGAPRWLKLEDTLTERGYAIELAVPLPRLTGHGRSTPILVAEVLAHDTDRATAGGFEATAGLRGRLHFSSHLPAYQGFLAATRLRPADFKLDRLVDLDAVAGTERVIAGGRFLGVLSDEFAFVELPASSAADVLAVELVDPSASGRPLIQTRTRQRGANGSRELLAYWRLDPRGQLERLLALEVAQDLDGRTIANRWQLVPAGSARRAARRPRAGARDLVVEVAPEDVVGWDAASYARVAPSTDATPILTPWGGRAGAVYWFDGDAVMGPEPLAPPPAAARRRKRR